MYIVMLSISRYYHFIVISVALSHPPENTLIVLEGFNIRIGICTLFLKREEMGVGW